VPNSASTNKFVLLCVVLPAVMQGSTLFGGGGGGNGDTPPCFFEASNSVRAVTEGLGTPILNVQGNAFVSWRFAGPLPCENFDFGRTLTASHEIDFYAAGEGPVRPGFAMFVLNAGGEGNVKTLWSFTRFGDYECAAFNVAPGYDCYNTSRGDFVPFTLGVPFRVQLQLLAQATNPAGASDVHASIRVQLFDSDYIPVNIVESTAPIPEPSSYALVVIGCVLLALGRLDSIHKNGERRLLRLRSPF
jgi:hypothetical protein